MPSQAIQSPKHAPMPKPNHNQPSQNLKQPKPSSQPNHSAMLMSSNINTARTPPTYPFHSDLPVNEQTKTRNAIAPQNQRGGSILISANPAQTARGMKPTGENLIASTAFFVADEW